MHPLRRYWYMALQLSTPVQSIDRPQANNVMGHSAQNSCDLRHSFQYLPFRIEFLTQLPNP